MANHEVALVAEDGGCPGAGQKQVDVEAPVMGKEAGSKEKRVSRQEREEDDTRLDEDDQEDEAIGIERTCCDPGSDGSTRIVDELGNRIDERH